MSIQQQFQAATSDSGFFQEPVELSNVYLSDPILKDLLLRYLPYEQYKFIEKDLIELGDKVINKVIKLGELSEYNLPSIKQYDHWGRRIDELNVHPAWTELQQLGCEEGLVSIPYELPIGDLSRLYQFSKIYLFTPGNMADCPLSMTDGMSRVITNLGTKKQKQEILTHLITRNKCNFYSAGQWMTERKGGSDVSGTETIAYQKEGQWFIDGFKWFSSATDAKVTLLLARVVDENGNGKEGSRGLSLFLAKVRDDNGKLNGVRIHRLKEKIGTKSLPTAELELKGMKAELIGEINRGIPNISNVLMITRVHCALTSSAGLRRAFTIAKEYACKRKIGSKKLCELPLHIMSLATIERKLRQCTQLAFYAAYLLGKYENLNNNNNNEDNQLMFRLCIPIAKVWCSKYSVDNVISSLEALGGLGYMEEIGVGKILRDILVNCIWEGTGNVMGLDVFRAIQSTNGKAWWCFRKVIMTKVTESVEKFKTEDLGYDILKKKQKIIIQSLKMINDLLTPIIKDNLYASFDSICLSLALVMGNLLVITLLMEQAAFSLNNHEIQTKLNHHQDLLCLKYEFNQVKEVMNPLMKLMKLKIGGEDKNENEDKNLKDEKDNLELGNDFGDGFATFIKLEYNKIYNKKENIKQKIGNQPSTVTEYLNQLTTRFMDDYDLVHPIHHQSQLPVLGVKSRI